MSRKWSMSFLLVTTMLVTGCDAWFMDEQQSLDTAREYLQARSFSAAAIELRNTLQSNPDNAEARFLLAGINHDYGDYATAEKEFRHARVSGWDPAQSVLGIMRARLATGNFSAAIDAYETDQGWDSGVRASLLALRAVAEAGLGRVDEAGESLLQARSLDAKSLDVVRTTIQLQYLDGNAEAAAEVLQQALVDYPDSASLLMLHANIISRDDSAASEEIYRQIIDLDPRDFISADGRAARLRLVQLYILDKDFDQAERTLTPLYRRDRNDPYTNYLGGVIAFQQGDYDEASERLLKVLKLAPEHNPTRLLFGTVNYAQKNFEQAAYFLDKYLIANADNLVARKLLARSYIMLGRNDDAYGVLQPAVTRQQNDAELLALAGISELNRGDTAAGIAGLQSAVKIQPGSMVLRSELARAYIEAGETGEAISELKGILASGGEQQQTETLLIMAHLRAGENVEAVDRVLDMVGRNPDSVAVLALTGNTFAATGDLDEARRYFARALQLQPDFTPALLSMAHIEEQSGNLAAAVDGYRQLVDSGAASIQPMIALARIADRQDDDAAVLDWLRQAVEKAPEDVRPLIYMAEFRLQAGDYEDASQRVAEALEIAPGTPELLALSGRIFIADGKYRKALGPLRMLIDKVPESTTARLLAGESYLQLGELRAAGRELHKALELSSDSVPARALLTKLEINAGKPGQALQYAREIQQLVPELFLGYELAGDSLLSSTDYAAAASQYEAAWERLPSSGLLVKRADNAMLSGQGSRAIGWLQDWLSERPEDVAVLAQLATYQQDAGQHEQAMKNYERVIELDDRNAVALNNLAGLYLGVDRLDEALELAEQAQLADRDNPGIQDTLGWALVQSGQYGRGLKMLESAMKQLSSVPEVRFHYAVAIYHSGNQDDARGRLHKLLGEVNSFEGREEASRLLQAWSR